MNKKVFIAVIISLATTTLYAHDSDELDELEKEIQEIKHRLSEVESVLNNPSNDQKAAISTEGWKSVTNWRKLTVGMEPSDVRKILGEPHRLDGGTLAKWYYQNGGRVIFFDGKVDRWREP